jgi:hypothetical protein
MPNRAKAADRHGIIKPRPYSATISWLEASHMVRTVLASALISLLGSPFSAAWAWWDEGHMQIAYVAYKHLDASVRTRSTPC